MLRLDDEQYIEATERLAKALERAEDAGLRTFHGRAGVMLVALGNDFDVSPMDVPNDVAEGNVWPDDHSALIFNFIDRTVEHNRNLGAW